MNMIQFNFIPEQLRKERGGFLSHGFGGVASEIFIGILLLVFGILFALHVSLVGVLLFKVGGYQMLQLKWNAMEVDKKLFDQISSESKAIQVRLNSLKPITSQAGFRWARVFNEVSDSVPKGIWLRQMEFSKGLLTISGSSVSKMANEMVSVGNFVAALKGKSSIKDAFTGVDVDSIQRREGTSLSIADFKLKAKRK
ncbi:MAG: PilN domain-containing protein [Candidatus Omnitrophica bacterium]|nr:PilN domain-containing protein [Candidatus Omnitrophota bacterium]